MTAISLDTQQVQACAANDFGFHPDGGFGSAFKTSDGGIASFHFVSGDNPNACGLDYLATTRFAAKSNGLQLTGTFDYKAPKAMHPTNVAVSFGRNGLG